MSVRIALIAIAAWAMAVPATAGPASHTAGEPPLAGEFQVGQTGIHCVKEPCPRRGIIQLGSRSRLPVWRRPTLPEVQAEPAIRGQLRRAWDEDGCLRVRGTFDGQKLVVEELVGQCLARP